MQMTDQARACLVKVVLEQILKSVFVQDRLTEHLS